LSDAPDLLVVGAGPAGVSAALWARSLELSVRVLEAGGEAGGQLHLVHFEPANFAGAASGPGPALASRLQRQLEACGADVRWRTPAESLESGAVATVRAGGARHEARAVLIATGARRRTLEVPGERELEGRGVSYSATQDRDRFAGEDVLVVGGGDAAYENALILADVGSRVTLAVRGAPRARRRFRDAVAAEPRIEVLEDTRVTAFDGGDRLRVARLEGTRGAWELPVAGVVIKAGIVPNTEWCGDGLELDDEGWIRVDDRHGTSHPRVWAAGDVTRPEPLGISVATGQAAQAVAALRAALIEGDG
jgi:thioredoxin reductase (NADPH)